MSEETIFAAALELQPGERAAYLAKACGRDAALRRRLEGLLAASDRAGAFMARPVVDAAGASEAATELIDANSTPNDPTVVRAGPDPAADDTDVSLEFLAPPTRSDSLGRIGHYEVLQVLGKGGFGSVFRAFDDQLQRVVAVKVMAPQLAATSPARKRFLREARSSAAVRHENVVQVYEVGESPLPYLVMEFIPGETLQQRLDRIGPVGPAEVVLIGRQIAEGLAAAHVNDLIHRDIKPGNILLEGGQQKVKITDFGLARAADDASISQSGLIAGTPMYMAPEQAKGDRLDQRADLFSLGSVLYQMAAGRPPFRANSTVAVLKRVAEDTPRAIREVIPETPQWLCDIIAKLHAKNPDDRYQSAREVADVLGDCEAQLKANSKLKDFSRIPRGESQPSDRRTWVAAAAILLLPLLALAVTELAGVTHLVRKPQQAHDSPIVPGGKATPVPVAKPDPPPAVAPFDAAQANRHQEVWAEHFGVPVEYSNSLGMKFRMIPPGEFVMGAADGDPKAKMSGVVDHENPRSAPRHLVRITGAYFAGVHEVTIGQFRKYTEATRGTTDAESTGLGSWQWDRAQGKMVRKPGLTWRAPGFTTGERSPVTCVTAQDATRFCEWLSQKEGRTYRLPTEAEWEYMCRAGTTTPFAYGPRLARAQAVFGADRTEAVGARPGNAFGLFDMHGNASEWCEDGPREYTAAATRDPRGPQENRRVLRGGDFDNHLNIHATLQSSGRSVPATDYSSWGTGFRVVLVDNPPRAGAAEVAKPEPLPPPAGKSLPVVNAPFADADVRRIAGLPAAEQVEEVRKELIRRNPGFDGTMEHTIENDTVTKLRIVTDRVTDIAPIRVFNALRVLDCSGTATDNTPNGQLTDLPLEGMNLAGLTRLNLGHTSVSDAGLAHFQGCKDLMSLHLHGTQVSDAGLAHFKDCKNLISLGLSGTQVTDAGLAHFAGCKNLTELNLAATEVTDEGLAHFKDCKSLKSLYLIGTQATESGLAHFKDCRELTRLVIRGTRIGDLTLLKGMPLKDLDCDFRPERDGEILRSIKSLEKINGKPAAEFWKDFNAGE